MPFTPAHAGLVLPLNYLPKKYISLSALVIGSMVPDFEYFFRMKPYSIYSHTLAGLFYFDVPLGIIVLLLYYKFVRNILIDNLPGFLNKRFSIYKDVNIFKSPLNVTSIVLCLLLGSISHPFWDAFTHVSGYFVVGTRLSAKVDIYGHEIPIFKLLQHSSTVIGFLVICYAVKQLPVIKATKCKNILPFWALTVAVTILILAVKIVTGLNISEYGSLIVSGMSGFLIGLLLSSIYTLRNKKRPALIL